MPPDVSASRPREEHFFFTPRGIGRPLYGRAYYPAAPENVGILIVPPIGRERLRVVQEMPSLARGLANNNFPVLRFDYRGEGESAGQFRDSTIASRVEDTIAAAEELRRRTGASRIALVGMHLGALVALLAARQAAAGLLVLADPVFAPRTYVTTLLRANIYQQHQYFGRSVALEGDLRASLRSGDVIGLYGFQAAAKFLDELESLEIAPALQAFSGKSAIFCFAQKPGSISSAAHDWGTLLGAPARCVVAQLILNFSWTTTRRWKPHLWELTAAVTGWLQQQPTAIAV